MIAKFLALAPPTVAPATYSQGHGTNELWLEPNRCTPEPVAKGDLGQTPEFHMQIALFIPRRIPTVSPSFIERNQLASMENVRSQFVHVVSPTLQAVFWRIGLEEVPELRRRPWYIVVSALATFIAVHRMDCAAISQSFDGGY